MVEAPCTGCAVCLLAKSSALLTGRTTQDGRDQLDPEAEGSRHLGQGVDGDVLTAFEPGDGRSGDVGSVGEFVLGPPAP